MSKSFVAILRGSDSELPAMQATFKVLKSFDISDEVRILSAHRTPVATHDYMTDAGKRGRQAFICAAGLT